MSSLRSICRPRTHIIFSSFICCNSSSSSSSRDRFRFLRFRCSFGNPDCGASSSRQFSSPSAASSSSSSCRFSSSNFLKSVSAFRSGSRRTFVRASKWTQEKSPYETLELERDADEETIKVAYRRLAKYYHPDGLEAWVIMFLMVAYINFLPKNMLIIKELVERMEKEGS